MTITPPLTSERPEQGEEESAGDGSTQGLARLLREYTPDLPSALPPPTGACVYIHVYICMYMCVWLWRCRCLCRVWMVYYATLTYLYNATKKTAAAEVLSELARRVSTSTTGTTGGGGMGGLLDPSRVCMYVGWTAGRLYRVECGVNHYHDTPHPTNQLTN